MKIRRFINIAQRSLIILALIGTLPLQAQRHEIFSPRIKTLQVVSGTQWLELPITQLDNGNPINIDFDDLTHDYHRYTYRIEHCDANWNPSVGLFDTDFMKGFNDGELCIEEAEQSVNTIHPYTHYHLAIPNDEVKLTMSGNYRLTIYDDDASAPEEAKVLSACFMVVEPMMKASIDYTPNTDIDLMKSHQQVRMTVDLGNLRVTHPQQVKTVVLQNGRWDNAVANAKPDYQSATQMEWRHVRNLIFEAGNEYRKFEFLDIDHPTMGIDDIQWDGEEYHVSVQTDTPRPNYVYDEAAKGSFYIRNSDNLENTITCQYAQIHFALQAPRQQGEVYLNGDWTQDRFLPEYKMQWDEESKTYQTSVLLKQGYYSYQYLVKDSDMLREKAKTVSTEGNFYPTKNRYDLLVYYRSTSDRTDRLVGYAKTSR